MEIRKRIKEGFRRRFPRLRKPPELKAILKERKALKLAVKQVTVDTLEKMWFDLDSKAVLMGTLNFIFARLTGYRWFKNKIKVKNDQSIWNRLIELINVLIKKLKEW